MKRLFLAAALAAAAPVAAAERVARDDDADGYCQMIDGVARSRSALMMAPELFVSFGVVNGNDAYSVGVDTMPPSARLTGGVRYSLMGLYQGAVTRHQAAAGCAQYRAVSQLHRFVQAYHDGLSAAALRARLAVLEQAIPQAEQILGSIRSDVASTQATIDELNATQLRVDALQGLRAQTRADLDSLSTRAQPPAGSIATVLTARDRAEASLADEEAKLRRSNGWDIIFRAGYDQVFGIRDHVPLFGVVSLSYNLGSLFQGEPEGAAKAGRLRWVRHETEGADDRVEQTIGRLRGVVKSERERLRETTVLLADLRARFAAVRAVENDKVARYRDYLWFDLVNVEAEDAYLRVHVTELDVALADDAARRP